MFSSKATIVGNEMSALDLRMYVSSSKATVFSVMPGLIWLQIYVKARSANLQACWMLVISLGSFFILSADRSKCFLFFIRGEIFLYSEMVMLFVSIPRDRILSF